MARENQGLQIALIILFMLTIILGVTTYIFCSRYIEADDRAAGLESDMADKTTASQRIQDESNQLKEMIGFKAEDEFEETISPGFRDDMETFAGAYDNVDKFYRPVLIHLYGLVNKKNAELTDANDALQKLQDEYDAWKRQMTAQVKKHDDARLAAEKNLADAVAMHTRDLGQIRAEKDKIKDEWEKAREEGDTRVKALEKQVADFGTERAGLIEVRDRWGKELKDLKKETFEVPDGTIRWVAQRNGTVWIDLGRGDSLRRQATFSVYPIDTTNLAKTGKKASIEVTRIRGEHLAEARIVEDSVSDPIMIGDKIHTPVWSPGEQRRFVLGGFMDLYSDGKNHVDVVADLIRMSGGRVDCIIDEKGDPVEGKISIDTRYMVLGESADAKNLPSTAKDYSKVITDLINMAKKNGMQEIKYWDLLKQMGWKNQTPVIRFGREANPKDFQPKPPEGVPRASTGPGRDQFQPRRPIAGQLSPRGGAY